MRKIRVHLKRDLLVLAATASSLSATLTTLLLVGELDHTDLHERTRFLQEKIAGSKRVVLPDAGPIRAPK